MASTKVPIELSSTPGIVDNSNATAITIDSSENVGIGTSSPSSILHLSAANDPTITLTDTGFGASADITGSNGNLRLNSQTAIHFDMADSEIARFDSSGQLGIGTTSPEHALHVNGGTANTVAQFQSTDANAYIEFLDSDAGASGCFIGGAGDDFVVLPNASEKFRVTSSGNVGIGNSSPVPSESETITIGNRNVIGEVVGSQGMVGNNCYYNNINWIAPLANNWSAIRQNNGVVTVHAGTNSTANATLSNMDGTDVKMTINTLGNVTIAGALSKGSGSFRIDHPLESKKDTHELVHSFVEAPQADNIYRGKVDLVDGSATVNIDTVAGMTEGTFVALNREVQCFTSNESDWDAVKGSVSGNILTIECQNTSSTATVSWLVIGERQDQHMYDTDWTDDNGKVIVEPLKTNEE